MKSSDIDLKPGCTVQDGSTHFRLIFPWARSVDCLIYSSFEEQQPDVRPMTSDDGESWQLSIDRELTGRWYQFRASYKKGQNPKTPYARKPFADPYSKHVTVRNNYRQEAKTLIFDDSYDWEGDSFLKVDDPRDLMIYETHIKDLVGHDSSKAAGSSIYNKWLDTDQTGGIPHLKKLGVNAVEFLPLQKFPPYEPPYKKKTGEGFHNTWNCYSQNYWGYMTSFFLAPETIYASDAGREAGDITGRTLAAHKELKDIIKFLHRNGISVLMDVVYNHTSLFDVNPLCHHMPDQYLRRDKAGKLMNRSGTGNEIKSESPLAGQLILDSVRFWMEEFHIDGFRFDLAGLLDEKSWDSIRETAQSIHPDVILIAEPWGGRYVPYLFSNYGWASWNDRFRNGIKGSDPARDRGFIFSDWHHGANRKQLENWFRGTVRKHEGGLFRTSAHAVNYLESHDGYTLGDFIRIVSRHDGRNPPVEDRDAHVALTAEEQRIARLGALCLMVAPGIVMVHAGQEFARSKIIVDAGFKDPETGRMDYNSYNKDNSTNWLNFGDLQRNRALFNYYRGLIEIRRKSPALRKAAPESICFENFSDPLHTCFYIDGEGSSDIFDYYIAINATNHSQMEFLAPSGIWEVLAAKGIASSSPVDFTSGSTLVPPQSGMLLRKLRH